ncbi:hypothetical protein QA612_04340 [Evansella sp. AB-P1]|uniref:hypothetical protein n=1 Tax=Evansella sp. AB-P1 TaxID=3037653 RepID=UPI00241EA172|nr:hypothetical protein [Evansella sp. AB-P1]MDG5786710.1 hypothetical protein [Evansella sp. AB-P1]
MYRRSAPIAPFIIISGTVIISIFLVVFFMFLSPSQQAKNVVDAFYSYEQESRFSSSWDLFHPLMKEKFSRNNYMQDRNHVFMNHFGVDTFSYTLSRPKKKTNWRMSEDAEVIDTVYKVTVTKKYKGKYGNFQIIQDTYAAKEENDWKVMWNYNH